MAHKVVKWVLQMALIKKESLAQQLQALWIVRASQWILIHTLERQNPNKVKFKLLILVRDITQLKQSYLKLMKADLLS